ncbi:hypothetical protein [Roseateles flavus]|uniref:Twin-arginine translocation pathway signal protein n=1 Tax=Roseateles flavus TaxID=3149041 RepID=A0ABV0GL15_9BURK
MTPSLRPMISRPLLASLVLLLGLSACAVQTVHTPGQKADTGDRLAEAATSPLNDLNLVRAKIPEVLLSARQAPYARPADCSALTVQLQGLNAVLGQDLDSPRAPGEEDWFGKAGDAFGDAAVSGLRSATEGLLPFRGWIRKLSGAERYNREVTAAIAAGLARRAYLRGLGQGMRCEPVAVQAANAASR